MDGYMERDREIRIDILYILDKSIHTSVYRPSRRLHGFPGGISVELSFSFFVSICTYEGVSIHLGIFSLP